MQLKYKLIGSLIAFAGANSTAIPFVLKSNIVQDYFSPSPNNLSLSSLNALSNSSTNTSLGADPKERIQFSENNSQYLELINNSAQLNSQLTNIYLDNQEQLPALSDLSSELSQTGFAVAVKQIRREIKREGGAGSVDSEQQRIIKAVKESLNNSSKSYLEAVKAVRKYNSPSDTQSESTEDSVSGKCVQGFSRVNYCYEDKTNKISKLDQKQREALRDFLKGYLNLIERSKELMEKLQKGNKGVQVTDIEAKKTAIEKILENLKKIHWDQEDMLYRYKLKVNEAPFGWVENGKSWSENPFSVLFNDETEWKMHIFRIIENENMRREKDKKEQNEEESKKALENIKDEIKLLVAVKLLEKMEQLGVTEVVEKLTK
ncbi:hypothetical protein MSUIS_06410 [Mycoplasma suis KI3806]|uniref:Uncharacterized protein n=1 Tax=Mycoplasma suis (strain KI_3806) TaxID=708248 RepID=F0V253_MYCS3|nr:hypothetical protein [Mycoplasma suis]CBZ40734.1 hypothetical protein MSUIS_06410 [Mycoplasma suis KI3806]